MISGDQPQTLRACLGEEQPVKRITVQRRQGGDGEGVVRFDRQLLPAPLQQGSAQKGEAAP